MPAIGPAFLHRPLPGLSAFSRRRAADWFLEGLRIALPPFARNVGWRPVLALSSRDGADQRLLVERSLFGETRRGPAKGEAPALPLAIALAPEDVFETRVNLPAAARGDLEEAVSHRLGRLSPLPRDLIEFAVGRADGAGDDRIDVGVVIVRKETIEACLRRDDGGAVRLIGHGADERGRFAYVFYERRESDADGARLLARLAAAIGALLLLFAGADLHLRHRLAALEAHEAALIETAKTEMARFRFLEEPPAAWSPGRDGPKALAALNAAGELLPSKAWIDEISFQAGVATIRGFAPEGEQWPAEAAPALAPSDRPGVAMFSMRIEADVPHE